MWFGNALIYQYTLNDPVDFAECLKSEQLRPCPPHARFIYGWLPVSKDALIYEVLGSMRLCLGKEERILPKPVVNQHVDARVEQIETEQARTVKRAERAQIAEDLEFELLPKSFCLQKRLYALIDTVNQHLIINTTSDTQAEQLTGLLRKSVPGISIIPLVHPEKIANQFVQWITTPDSIPQGFQLAEDCLLFSPDNPKKKVTCKGYELPADEILALIEQGLLVSELSLIWDERIQFTLTDQLTLKRLKPLDYLLDQFEEAASAEDEYMQRDAEQLLLAASLRDLIKALLAGFYSAPLDSTTNPSRLELSSQIS